MISATIICRLTTPSKLPDPGHFLQGHIDARVDMVDATDIDIKRALIHRLNTSPGHAVGMPLSH